MVLWQKHDILCLFKLFLSCPWDPIKDTIRLKGSYAAGTKVMSTSNLIKGTTGKTINLSRRVVYNLSPHIPPITMGTL